MKDNLYEGVKTMTEIYFIRHAESDNSVRDGRIRPLTEKGLASRVVVTEFLQEKNIDVVLSSPFKRAVDTISDFAEKNGFKIRFIDNFREQRSSSDMRRDNPDFRLFLQRQWSDFIYAFSDGECLQDVQKRNIAALNDVLTEYKGKRIVIGTHATALSTIINYYDNTYGFKDFEAMENKLPWAVKLSFEGLTCVEIEKFDLIDDGGKLMYSQEFWIAIDKLIADSKIIIDRPKGSRHPKYNDCIYKLDYGYLENTSSMDGGGIDVWRGSLDENICDAIVCTIDLIKRDSEIKIVIGCNETEKDIIMQSFDNENMKGIMIHRK